MSNCPNCERLTRENEELRESLDSETFHQSVAISERDRLRAALEKIASYDPGRFRPLKDEIAIHRIATKALESSRGETKAEPRLRVRITPRSKEVYEALVKFQRVGELSDIELAPPAETPEQPWCCLCNRRHAVGTPCSPVETGKRE